MEERVESSINIVGTTIESLKYNLDEEHIKDMFTNILISDMTKDKKEKVLPAYIEIVKQLSSKGAVLLKTLRELHTRQLSVLMMRDSDRNTGSYRKINYVIVPYAGRTITPDLVSLDNLERLGLIKILNSTKITSEAQLCESTFNYVKNHYKSSSDGIITYEQGLFEVTDLGANFIDVCTR